MTRCGTYIVAWKVKNPMERENFFVQWQKIRQSFGKLAKKGYLRPIKMNSWLESFPSTTDANEPALP